MVKNGQCFLNGLSNGKSKRTLYQALRHCVCVPQNIVMVNDIVDRQHVFSQRSSTEFSIIKANM